MAQAKKTAGKTAPEATVETVTEHLLSRGQKAAATRRANAAKKAAEAAKSKAVQTRKAKIMVRTKVAPKASRQKALSILMKEQKARNKLKAKLQKERAAHAAAKSADKQATDKRVKGVAAIRATGRKAVETGTLGILRHTAVLAATRGKRSSYDYAAALNSEFPGWHDFQRKDATKDTNHGVMVAAFFAEQKVFYEDFRANFDGVGDCNPSATWANVKKYGRNLLVDGIPKPRGGASHIDLLSVAKRDVEKLYLRINNDEEAFDASEKLQNAAAKLGEALVILGLNLTAVNAKFSSKQKKK